MTKQTRKIQISFTLSEKNIQEILGEAGIETKLSKLTDDQFDKLKTFIDGDDARQAYMESAADLGEAICESGEFDDLVED